MSAAANLRWACEQLQAERGRAWADTLDASTTDEQVSAMLDQDDVYRRAKTILRRGTMNPELVAREEEVMSMVAEGADKRRLWAVVWELRPYRDGNRWCVSTSPNDPLSGVSAWGASPVDALDAFEREMYSEVAPEPDPRDAYMGVDGHSV